MCFAIVVVLERSDFSQYSIFFTHIFKQNIHFK